MKKTLLFLIRHGATGANVARPYVLQGLEPDNDLIDLGRDQADAAGYALRDYPISKIYSSPSKRAQGTAQRIAEILGVPFELEDGLLEADVGQWTGRSWPEIQRSWPEEFQAFEEDAERHGYLGGENLAQVRDRGVVAVEKILDRHEDQTIAIVGHGVMIRVLLAHWIGLPLRYARRIPLDNAAYNRIEFEDDEPKVRTVNMADHLLQSLLKAA